MPQPGKAFATEGTEGTEDTEENLFAQRRKGAKEIKKTAK